MPQKPKKCQNPNVKGKENIDENKKSNLKSRTKKSFKDPKKVQFEDKELQLNELSLAQTSNMKAKSLGFWSKKLQYLEENETKKKSAVYEFSGSDESECSYRIKKKMIQKPRLYRKRQPIAFNKKKQVKKTKKLQETEKEIKKNLNKEHIVLSQENEKISPTDDNFMPSTQSQFVVTSTPAANKFIDPSNFLLLSPIINEGVQKNVMECSSVILKVVDKGSPTVHLEQETPKLETRLKKISCRTVLRSGKILDS